MLISSVHSVSTALLYLIELLLKTFLKLKAVTYYRTVKVFQSLWSDFLKGKHFETTIFLYIWMGFDP